MSATVSSPTMDISDTPRVPFARLVSTELRKMTDTRAGRWLLGITVTALVAVMVIALLVAVFNDLMISLDDWIEILPIPISLLLPVIAITAITQEWGQRTGLVTFSLEPRRSRVVLAKFAAVVTFAVLTLLLAVALGVLGNVLFGVFGTLEPSWDLDLTGFGWALFTQIALFVMAFGFGMVFLSTPVAIVVYYVISLLLPLMVYGAVYALVSWGPDVIPWLDLGFAIAPFTTPELPKPDLAEAQLAFTTFVWVILPLLIGMWRIRRGELK